MSSKLCPLANSQPTICCFHTHTWNNGLAINMLNEYIFTLHKQWNYGLDFADPQGLIFNRAQWITVKSLCPDIYCLQGHSQMCLLAAEAVADVLTVSKVSYKNSSSDKSSTSSSPQSTVGSFVGRRKRWTSECCKQTYGISSGISILCYFQ